MTIPISVICTYFSTRQVRGECEGRAFVAQDHCENARLLAYRVVVAVFEWTGVTQATAMTATWTMICSNFIVKSEL